LGNLISDAGALKIAEVQYTYTSKLQNYKKKLQNKKKITKITDQIVISQVISSFFLSHEEIIARRLLIAKKTPDDVSNNRPFWETIFRADFV
jgi:hypothetical protein